MARRGARRQGEENHMTGYRSDVPENWYVDPVNLGVP